MTNRSLSLSGCRYALYISGKTEPTKRQTISPTGMPTFRSRLTDMVFDLLRVLTMVVTTPIGGYRQIDSKSFEM